MPNKFELALGSKSNLSLRRSLLGGGGLLLAVLLMVGMDPGDLEGRLAGFDWRLGLSLDSSQVHLTQPFFDFPLHLKLQHPDLRTAENGGKLQHPEGFDIRFSSYDGATQLMHEVISYDPVSGQVEAWINIDTLFPDQENMIYAYFGAFIPVDQRDLSLGERRFNGFFYNKRQGAKKDKSFSKEWMALEKANAKNPGAFLVAGEVENVQAPMPVQFQYFNAAIKGQKINLVEWGTDFEANNDYFELQKSTHARAYSTIAILGGGDRSARLLRYSYSDELPGPAGVYYRLKQVNNNGLYIYTLPIYSGSERNEAGISIQGIEPNPFTYAFEATFHSGVSDKVTIQLFSVGGNLIHEEVQVAKKGTNTFSYADAQEALPFGAYILTIMGSDNKLQVAQIMKEKEI